MPGNIPSLGPTIISKIANSAGVFFGFKRKSARVLVKNQGAVPLKYHFEILSGDADFATLEVGGKETIVDQVMGIHVKTASGVCPFDAIATYEYLA